MSGYSRLQQLESCIQIFLTDSSQYLIISGHTPEERTGFLKDFSEGDYFSHKITRSGSFSNHHEFEDFLGETDVRLTEVMFLDFTKEIDFHTIRSIIDNKMIDSKIVMTSKKPVDALGITNFRLPEPSPDTDETVDSLEVVTPPPSTTSIEPNRISTTTENIVTDIPTTPDTLSSEDQAQNEIHLEDESTVVEPQATSPLARSKITEFADENNASTPPPNPSLSLREYSERQGLVISAADLLAKKTDMKTLETIFSEYIMEGGIRWDQEKNDSDFSEKLAIMNQELFEKEQGTFLEYIRTLAMTIGNLYKEDQIAQLMNISRRKVKKYTDILIKHRMITAIAPFVEDTRLELSRHVKLYFTDLSSYKSALGVLYGVGTSRSGIIENFIYLELARKLSTSHEIRFWKKKSGTELQFVLVNRATQLFTPIEVSLRSSSHISQAMKSFYESYGERVEYGMLLNESEAEALTYNNKSFLILPHSAI